MQRCNLYLLRKARRKPVHINFNGIPTLGFYENLVTIAIGKALYFIFNRRAISWPQSFNSTSEHWGPVESGAQYVVHLGVGIGDVAASLFFERLSGIGIRKFTRHSVAWLFFHFGVVERATVNPWRCSGFHPSTPETEFLQLLSNTE